METTTKQTSAQRTAEQLAERWAHEGYTPGTPHHLLAFTRLMDASICKRLKCPGCHHQGMEYRPYHRGRAYKALAVCPRCLCGEEV